MTTLETATDSARAGLDSFWRPDSVAVIGASDNPAKWGHWLAAGALEGATARTVHLVNQRGGTVCGAPVLTDIRHAERNVDLAVICVPPHAAVDSAVAALDSGANALLVITDGLDTPSTARLTELAHGAGARLLGPSSLGIVDTSTRLRLAWGRFTPGPVAVVTQSGQVGSELTHLLSQHGSGTSRFVSVGAQPDVGVEEVLAELADDPDTRAVTLYLEQVRDADAFLAAAAALRAADKPLVVLAAGTSTAGSAAAKSHTGALTAGIDVLDAACRAAGACRVATPAQAAALAHGLSLGVRPRGDRVAIVSDSGGQAALAADAATEAGLRVESLERPTVDAVSELLPHAHHPGNPVDLAGAGEQDLTTYTAVPEALGNSTDTVLLTGYFGRFGEDTPTLATEENEVSERLAKLGATVPTVVHTMADTPDRTRSLAGGGVPAFTTIELAVHTLAACARWATVCPRDLPARAPSTEQPSRPLSYLDARALVGRAGVPVTEAEVATSATHAGGISRSWPEKSVLKADLAHKTEQGGVVLGLRDEEEVARAHHELTTRLGSDGIVVERMDERDNVVELLLGVHTDPVFGPVVLVGAGGVQAELWRDTAMELAPVSTTLAATMLGRLRSYPLLSGWRGTTATDVDAVAAAVATVSQIPFQHPGITSIDVNPLRAGPDGVLAVDAYVAGTTPESESTTP